MTLYPNWKYIARKAWSFRLMVLAGVLTTTEALLPLYTDVLPRGVFSLLTLVSIIGGMISRLVAQKGIQ